MKIVLTNDDGIGAPGLAALARACDGMGSVTVVAPAGEQSAIGHRVTTRQAIQVRETRPGWFEVEGTPADCARLALTDLAPEATWVLSGINRGGNLGVDTYMSGTVAAAREAALLGRRAVAISQYVYSDRHLDWDLTIQRLLPLIRDLMGRSGAPDHFWNVNLPHPDHQEPDLEAVHCPVDSNPLDVRFRREGSAFHYDGNYHARPRTPGSDIDVCFQGRIAVSRIPLSPTGE